MAADMLMMASAHNRAISPLMPSPHTSRHYHPVGIFFHWLMAGLVFVQLWWGWRTSATYLLPNVFV